MVTLFDAAGNFLNSNNDDACAHVKPDGVTGNCFDSFLSLFLAMGAYQVALTEGDNLAIGPALADGFLQTGNDNFTCPQFLGKAGAFCDASPAQRTNAYALDITTPDAATGAPEPASIWLLLTAVAGFAAAAKFRNTEDKLA